MHHPSIMLWGVRINESQDCDELYRKTNAVAHTLDSGRQTSGVGPLEKSRLLEDVYAYNDFSHTGRQCRSESEKERDEQEARAVFRFRVQRAHVPDKAL